MDSSFSLSLPAFVSRIIVLIPQLDYGFLEQVREIILTTKENSNSTKVEIVAAKRAKEICDGTTY